MEPKNNTTGKIVAALAIGLIVGFVVGALWQNRRLSPELPAGDIAVETSQKKAAGQNEETANTTVAEKLAALDGAKGFSIDIEDQTAGSSIIVGRVSATEPVWVAVRELGTTDGALGNILGAGRIAAGGEAVVVELLRPTVAERKYSIVLYRDIGEPAFNYREDVLVLGVRADFTAK